MDFTRLFLRMSRIARNPPSMRSLMIFLAVLAISAVIFGIEWMGWWPEWATADRARPPRIDLP